MSWAMCHKSQGWFSAKFACLMAPLLRNLQGEGGGVQLKYGVVSPTLVSKWAFSWICSLSSIPHVLSPEKNQREARTDCIRGEHPRFDERLKIYPQLQKYYYQVVCVTHRLEVLHNSVQWGKMFEFECQTAVNSLSGVLDDCMCRLSVRKVS